MINIGDKVLYFGEEGVVEAVKLNSSADVWKSNLYTVKFKNETKFIAESLLDTLESPKSNIDKIDNYCKDLSNEDSPKTLIDKKCIAINKKIDNIFNKLSLNFENESLKIKNAFKLFKYIIENSKYDEKIMQEKKSEAKTAHDIFEFEVNDIYKCLCEGRSVCSSDAATLSLLFRRAGIDSIHLTIAENGISSVHEVVEMKFGKKIFICDPTLTRTLLETDPSIKLNPSIFAFSPQDFFSRIYPNYEVVYEHDPIDTSV